MTNNFVIDFPMPDADISTSGKGWHLEGVEPCGTIQLSGVWADNNEFTLDMRGKLWRRKGDTFRIWPNRSRTRRAELRRLMPMTSRRFKK